MRKYISIIICLLTACTMLYAAQATTVKTVIRSWQLPTPTYLADTCRIDSSYLNLPMRDILNDYSISNAWNGNTVSPVQSRIFFSRLNTIDDIFGTTYAPYILTPQRIRFYNTTIPYSEVAYRKGFTKYHEDNQINFFFTGNLNRRTNLGMQIDFLNSPGHYISQEGKLFRGNIFGSYNGDHYSLQASVSLHNVSNFENGGLRDTADLRGPLNTEDYPVRLNAMSGYQYISGFLNHSYSISAERERHDSIPFINEMGEREMRDTVRIDYIPLITFAHTFETNNSRRRYIEKKAAQGYYNEFYLDSVLTRDTSNVLTISNTLSVTFEEAFNRVLRFGAMAFARYEAQRFVDPFQYLPTDDPLVLDTISPMQWNHNVFVGGSIYKRDGRYIHYGVAGDVCLYGYKLGQFNVDGHIDADFPVGKNTMFISARAYVKNETPHYYLQHYRSNHFCWDNDLQKTYRFYVGGMVAYPTEWVKPRVDVGFENLTRYIYFGDRGLPVQHEGNIQVLAVDARVDLTTPWINLENHAIYQHSSDQKALPLPAVTLYHNLYYHGCWFRALDTQFGVNMRYFTRYYAPMLNPATGQFCSQQEQQIGNYPMLNVYANFYVRLLHLKIFAEYSHFNRRLMKNPNYYAMPMYPMNPDVFRAGLAWHFYK